ncbi:hypothetical protein KK471_28705, partial [Klebsiella pneumoniae]|uniref:hypothetical protein n=1 Tax=Klebsiella pneumoniae TaxID=573 RepID=UPI001BE00141
VGWQMVGIESILLLLGEESNLQEGIRVQEREGEREREKEKEKKQFLFFFLFIYVQKFQQSGSHPPSD